VTPVAVTLLALGALFTMISSLLSGVMLFRMEARATRERERDARAVQMASDLRSLREGMSQGAERAFRTLASRLDTLEDDADQTREAVTIVRERVAALDRTVEGHIHTPHPIAHPTRWTPGAQG